MQDQDDIVHITVGTAGHIDHGKSALVKALTGTDPDRLKEEKERGMTIDLGYAGMKLSDGREVGIIDVPGHERFIRNMVAGASAIDFVVLVIAADDSVMPQTREHLEIMELLGIARGMTVITKTDLVDEELIELVEEDIRDFLKGSFLENAPVARVSSVTGEGIPELAVTLQELVQQVEPKSAAGVFRMPVQRVFSAKGYGAVVTGVPVCGRITKEDKVEVLPRGRESRIRGIQVYGRDRNWARAGHRTALNLADVDFHKVSRGDVVCSPGYFQPSRTYDGKFESLTGQRRKLGQRTGIRLHVGTAEAVGVMLLLDKKSLAPGEPACVQYRLDTPIVAGIGDRCVVRLQSPLVTIGGGPLLGGGEGRPRQLRSRLARIVAEKCDALGDDRAMLAALLKERLAEPTEIAQMRKLLHVHEDRAKELLDKLLAEGEVLPLPKRRRYIHSSGLDWACERTLGAVEKFFRDNPLRVYCDLKHLANITRLDEDVLAVVAQKLASQGKVDVIDSRISMAGRRVRLSREEEDLASEIEKIYLNERFSGPSFGDLLPRVRGPQEKVKKVLDFLLEKGDITRIGDNTYIHQTALLEARDAIVRHFQANSELSPADMKNLIGTSRKFAIPLMEHFDREGLTVRKGNVRCLARRDSQQ
jgi:selenocysteine-specific elongation factor